MAGFGDFAGGFAGGFAKTMQLKQENERQDKIAKLQGQLLELQLKGQKQKIDATEKISELSTGSLGGFDIGKTTEVNGRKQTPIEMTGRNPMSLTEILADPEGQMAAIQSGMANLGDFTGGREPADLQMLRAAGIDPASPEGQELVKSAVGGKGNTATEEMMAQLQILTQTMMLEEKRRERSVEEKTETQRVKGVKVSVRDDFHHAREAIQIQRELENTALQSGVPFGEFMTLMQSGGAAVAGALGFDMSKTRDLVAKRQRLEKLFADGIIESIDRFAESGSVTNDKFGALIKASPDIGKAPQANAQVLADRLQAALDAANIEEIDIAEREEIEAFIKEMRNFSVSDQETVVDVPGAAATAADAGRAVVAEAKDIARMSIEQIRSIDPSIIKDWTEEQKKALDKRLTELGF